MRKTIKIRSIHRYDKNYNFMGYYYTPVSNALRHIMSDLYSSVDIINCEQINDEILVLRLRGKRKDINRLIISFINEHGRNFYVQQKDIGFLL